MPAPENPLQRYAQACAQHLRPAPAVAAAPARPTFGIEPFTRRVTSLLPGAVTAMIGYTIHGSLFWAAVDFFFAPVVLAKWLICHELTADVLVQTFYFFFN